MRLQAIGASVLVWFAGAIQPLHASELVMPEAIAVGVVEEADIAAGTMIIEGYRYGFAPNIPVRTGGVESSVIQVTPGMQAQFRFLRLPDGSREMLELREIPPGVELENH